MAGGQTWLTGASASGKQLAFSLARKGNEENGVMGNSGFEKFKVKREELRTWFNCPGPPGENYDRNCIESQLCDMVWKAGAFRLINEARGFAKVAEDGTPELSPLLHDLLNICFFESFAIAVRRLLDPDKNVYSLGRVLHEIEKSSSLFTRANILRAADRAYDFEKARAEWVQTHPDPRSLTQADIRQLDRFDFSQRCHEAIDRLCGVHPEQRQPDDTIRKCALVQVRDSLETIKICVDKSIAHAATPESRKTKNADELKLTLGDLWAGLELICRVSSYVRTLLLGLPSWDYLQYFRVQDLTYLESPLITRDRLAMLRKEFEAYEEEVKSWGRWDLGLPFCCDP
jgi:hypothetical protein